MSNPLSSTSCVALSKSLNLSVPQFPHLYNGGNTISLKELLNRLSYGPCP